ncbi:MAG: GNAT family N-acetyltransferase [Proteobacteria bacterium]|nr:GNAT family N-acetyltransferase [Pseudomonadota bacterium]
MPELKQPDPTPSGLPAGGTNTLERIAAWAWPASEVFDLDGWTLRADPAPTRRVNSAALWRETPEAAPLDQRITAVEAFYRARNRPPRFQVTAASVPAGIDAVLAARGYQIEAPVDIQTAAPCDIRTGEVAKLDTRLDPTASPDWHRLYRKGYGRDISSVLAAITDSAIHPLCWQDGRPVALALAVLVDGWAGIFGMLTEPERRGQGIGRAIIQAISGWAVANRAQGLYLQVENNNSDAKRLYERCGFRTRYSYHYRLLETPH